MPLLLLAWGFVKSGLGSAFAFLSKLSLIQLALLVVTVAGIGFHVMDQRHIRRVEAHDAATSRALGKERIAHAADIARWKAASEAATKLNTATIARVATEQKGITDAVSSDYESRLADLRARWLHHVTPSNKRPANGVGASPLPASASPVDGQAVPSVGPDLGYTAEVELQLNALIDWNRKQAAVDPNAR